MERVNELLEGAQEPVGAKPQPGWEPSSEAPQHSVVTLVGANTAWPLSCHSGAWLGRGWLPLHFTCPQALQGFPQ